MEKVRSKAPLRLGFAGGGSDVAPYCDLYGGAVLNATIDLSAYCTIAPSPDGMVRFQATDRDEVFIDEPRPSYAYDGLLDLHKGVYNRVVRDYNNGEPLKVHVTTFSDAPAGSGLGSSSTMVVAILSAYTELLHLPLGEFDIARMAFEIERRDIGLRGGGQDQYAATFGGVNFLEFYENDRVVVNPLRVKNWILNELQASLVLFFSGVSRESDKIIAEQVKNYQQKSGKSIDAVHALKKDAFFMKDALLKGNIQEFGAILGRSWEAKRQVAANISTPLMEEVLDRARKAGAWSGKVSGAGGGGFMMLMVDPIDRMQLISALNSLEGRVVHFNFVKQGTQAWRI